MELALRQAPDGIVVSDLQGKITLANTVARQLAQVDPEGRQLISAPGIWGEMFDLNGRHIPAQDWPWMRALGGETTIGGSYHLTRLGGSSYDVLFNAVPIRLMSQRVVGALATLIDVTERKRAELVQRQEAVWKERSRMAADLHDSLAQSLNAVVLQLEAAGQILSENPDDARRHVRRALEVARESLTHARNSMWTLSEAPLENEDLASGLVFLAKHLFTDTAVRLEFSLEERTQMPGQETRIQILRIAKEALANALKHARATTVRIELAYRHRNIYLCVHDNGQGFLSAPLPAVRRTFGMGSMYERAKALGGSVVVRSQPGRGTQVIALVPLSPEGAQSVAA
jgi:signal transduction histidine kinase